MRKYLFGVLVIMIFLAIVIPLASVNPDGLEKIAQSLGIEGTPFWVGLMSDYSVGIISNPYISTFIAGVAGVLLVLLFSSLLGKVLIKKSKHSP